MPETVDTSPTLNACVINMSYEGRGGPGRVALQPLIGKIYGDREQEIKQRLTDERAREDRLRETSTSRKNPGGEHTERRLAAFFAVRQRQRETVVRMSV